MAVVQTTGRTLRGNRNQIRYLQNIWRGLGAGFRDLPLRGVKLCFVSQSEGTGSSTGKRTLIH